MSFSVTHFTVLVLFSAAPGILIFGTVFVVSVHNGLQFRPSLWKAKISDRCNFIVHFYCFWIQGQWL